jgi:hypothetical protein
VAPLDICGGVFWTRQSSLHWPSSAGLTAWNCYDLLDDSSRDSTQLGREVSTSLDTVLLTAKPSASAAIRLLYTELDMRLLVPQILRAGTTASPGPLPNTGVAGLGVYFCPPGTYARRAFASSDWQATAILADKLSTLYARASSPSVVLALDATQRAWEVTCAKTCPSGCSTCIAGDWIASDSPYTYAGNAAASNPYRTSDPTVPVCLLCAEGWSIVDQSIVYFAADVRIGGTTASATTSPAASITIRQCACTGRINPQDGSCSVISSGGGGIGVQSNALCGAPRDLSGVALDSCRRWNLL